MHGHGLLTAQPVDPWSLTYLKFHFIFPRTPSSMDISYISFVVFNQIRTHRARGPMKYSSFGCQPDVVGWPGWV